MTRPEVRPLCAADLDAAERVMKTAFGTFVGLPQPERFGGDTSFVRSRWQAQPHQAFGAFLDGELVGSNLATRWGSFGFFGPLSVRPDCWNLGFATPLMEPILECFSAWKLSGSGLFTFPHSPKHVGLYQKFGFRPETLTVILEKSLDSIDAAPERWNEADPADEGALGTCRDISETVFPGLDLSAEIEATSTHCYGDTVLTPTGNGFAVCHRGPGSEAGSDVCYVKFAAARSGAHGESRFLELVDTCEHYAADRGARTLVAGVNVGRTRAYERLLERHYRIAITGISMHRPGPSRFTDPDSFVLDDWR